MSKKRTFWLDAYRETVFDRKQGPDLKLIEYLDIIPKGPVLDLGMGRGRHAMFFAKLGHEVEGVDTSKLSKGIDEMVESEGLKFTHHRMDLREFEIPKRKYALIIASKIIQLFRKADIERLGREDGGHNDIHRRTIKIDHRSEREHERAGSLVCFLSGGHAVIGDRERGGR